MLRIYVSQDHTRANSTVPCLSISPFLKLYCTFLIPVLNCLTTDERTRYCTHYTVQYYQSIGLLQGIGLQYYDFSFAGFYCVVVLAVQFIVVLYVDEHGHPSLLKVFMYNISCKLSYIWKCKLCVFYVLLPGICKMMKTLTIWLHLHFIIWSHSSGHHFQAPWTFSCVWLLLPALLYMFIC